MSKVAALLIILMIVGVWTWGCCAEEALDEQECIDTWVQEGGLSGQITVQFMGYTLEGKYLGWTHAEGDTVYIYLHGTLEGKKVALSVLWHEYCHAVEWARTGAMSGHGVPWIHAMTVKPHLCVYSFFCAFPSAGITLLWRCLT